MMKILSGRARGRILNTGPQNPALRPILARVKKSIFDIIRPRIHGARFLDIFAGTGSVGLEAISQGASFAAFVEREKANGAIIRDNLIKLKFDKEGAVFGVDVMGDLSVLPKPFDIIFMGPPYKDSQKNALSLVIPTLNQIDKFELMRDGGIVVAQHHQKEPVTDSEHWHMYRREKYGDTLVSFFERKA